MSFLRHLFGMDRPVREPSPDPDAVVWVATVALWQAPLVVHELEQQMIRASFAESSSRRSIVGGFAAARIYVQQRHRAEAERIILELTG